ncbi:MAG: hypothetical protein GY841_05605 [FCB group bacterium]|nr:hypothetical protein [FCB group bacterium]
MKAKAGFHIGVTCPGCGGELELQKDYFSLECPHCGSVLRLKMPEKPPAYILPARKNKREIRFQVDRWLKQNGLPLTRSEFTLRRIYAPYWKIEAIRLKVGHMKTRQEVGQSNFLTTQLDYHGVFQYGRAIGKALTRGGGDQVRTKVKLSPFTSTVTAGPPLAGMPASIGMRSEYIKAYPFSRDRADDQFEYLPVAVPWNQIIEQAQKSVSHKARLNAGVGGKAHSELFNPTGSLIYFPYFIVDSETGDSNVRLFLDGLSGRIEHADHNPRDWETGEGMSPASGDWGELTVDFHRCGNCGVDLPADQSSVYICQNCHEVTVLDSDLGIHDGIVSASLNGDDQQFPFWSLTIPPDILVQAGLSLPGNNPPERLVVPAFKIRNFDALARLCRRMTLTLPEMTTTAVKQYDQKFMPAAIGLSEAIAMAEIILHTAVLGKGRSLPDASMEFIPDRVGLVYAPFHPQNYFFVDSVLGTVTFEKCLVD